MLFKNTYQNKKIDIMFGILLVLLILSLLQISWAFGGSPAFKDQKSVKLDKSMTRLSKKLPPSGQDSVLRQSGQYFGEIYSVVVNTCKETCSVQCAANDKNSLAQSACEKGCKDYYAKKSDQEAREGLRTLHTACKK